jgi:DNA polymerase-4
MRSIDEGVLDFHGTKYEGKPDELVKIGYEIKERVKREIGDYMTVNIGIAPNRFLAKTAAGLHKPDGLDVIDYHNLIEVFDSLELQDLNGIADGYGSRLRAHSIFTPPSNAGYAREYP